VTPLAPPADTVHFGPLFKVLLGAHGQADGSGKKVIVNFGESEIIRVQTIGQLLRDALWAILSVVIAMSMLRIGTQSTFLTLTGMFQVMVRPSLECGCVASWPQPALECNAQLAKQPNGAA
jgi:hypothetical protein